MIKKLQHVFALSENGAKGLLQAVIWTIICNISLMLPIGAIMATIQHLMEAMETGGDPMSNLWYYVGVGVLILIVMTVFHYFQYAALYLTVYKESASRRITLAETLRRLPLSFFGNRDLSDLTATMIADCTDLDQMFSHYIPVLIASVFSTSFVAIMMFICDWRMALAVLWVAPISVGLVLGSRKLQDTYGTRSILAKRATTESIQECLETIRDIKSCNLQEDYLKDLNDKTVGAENAAIRSELVTGVSINAAQVILKLGIATTVLVGSMLLINGSLSFLYFIGFLFASVRLYDPLSLALQNIAATFNAKLKIERMRAIMEEPFQTGAEECDPNGFDIVFDGVDFAYNENEGVLKEVSFDAKQGEVTALVGPSGGGKTTATKLAARFWDVNKGKITLGGIDISTVHPEALLKHYAFVFQDVVLFRDTVMENIRLGRRDASDEEVYAAARAARCDEFIRRLPDGYSTMIGENGSTLSGGERQRISIARALLKDAPIILLDEATASLDVENESAVQSAISELVKNKTVLIIAHRMRTVAGANKIVVLDGGRVTQMGSPDELLAEDGIYRHMVERQRASAAWQI